MNTIGAFGLLALCVGVIAGVGSAASPETGAHHDLPATPETVAWGFYWSESPPVLRIESGDVVHVETLITSSPTQLEGAGIPPEKVQQSLRDIHEQVTDKGPGVHILTGPIYIEGAEPGDVLEVRVLSVDLAVDYGNNRCAGFVPDHCEGLPMRMLALDAETMTTEYAPGIVIPLRPFFGSMGVAPPPEAGRWSSIPPWIHAGNLDNRELVPGTSLFIPVHVPGALFQVGDGHAAQGNGEVDQTAIETSLEGELAFIVHKDMSLEWPIAETPTHFITMGTHEDLDEATKIALEQTIVFLMDRKGLTRGEAYQLASLMADFRITQLVDQKLGVHVMLSKAILGG